MPAGDPDGHLAELGTYEQLHAEPILELRNRFDTAGCSRG